jgi:hypothetical protein
MEAGSRKERKEVVAHASHDEKVRSHLRALSLILSDSSCNVVGRASVEPMPYLIPYAFSCRGR